jgi:hypothetical protein
MRTGVAWMPGSRPGMTLKGCAMSFFRKPEKPDLQRLFSMRMKRGPAFSPPC